MFWFDKKHPNATYIDIREHEEKLSNGQTLRVKPDVLMDFRKLNFPKNTFKLVVFDPPHITSLGKNSWMAKKYGVLDKDTWKEDIKQGFDECWRVLKKEGVLIFKWSEDVTHPKRSVTVRQVLDVIGKRPLFGHPTGKNGSTMWMCFIKLPTTKDTDHE